MFLDYYYIDKIAITMPENREEKPKRSSQHSDSSKRFVTADRTGFVKFDDSILNSLPEGVIAFDSDLKIIWANSQAKELIELGDYIDKSLAKGTDDHPTLNEDGKTGIQEFSC